MLGLSLLYLLYSGLFDTGHPQEDLFKIVTVLTGFSFGASSIALFARVGGGIYTKAADVGADLVGKVEAGIPEDDPRNPAVIADNVGDNVGDVAGMGADLFESYVGSIVGALVLGVNATKLGGDSYTPMLVVLPMMIAGVGVLVSLGGTFLVRTREGGNPAHALDRGTFGSAIVMLAAIWFLASNLLEGTYVLSGKEFGANGVFLATVAGLVGGVLIGKITEYYTSEAKKPAQGIAKDSLTGAATNIISGLAVGMRSTALPSDRARRRDSRRLRSGGSLRHRDRRARHALDDRDPARRRRLRSDRRQRRRHRRDVGAWAPRSAHAPTSSTPSATRRPRSARASPSARPR